MNTQTPVKGNFDLKQYDTTEAKEQGLHVFEVILDAPKECSRSSCSPAQLFATINSIGMVIASKPEQSAFTEEPPTFSGCSFLLATMIDDPEVLFPGLQIEPLSYLHYTPEELPAFVGSTPVQPSVAPAPAQFESTPVVTSRPTPPVSTNSDRSALLRSPEQSVRIPVEIADKLMNLAGELVVVRNRSQQVQATGNAQDGAEKWCSDLPGC